MTWLTRRQRDGAIDPIGLPDGVEGSLWLCGKHAIAPHVSETEAPTSPWLTIVCLTERHELADRYPEYVAWLKARSAARDRAIWLPIPDLSAPPLDAMVDLVDAIASRLRAGEDVLVHCAAGLGRAGTTAACVLIRLGLGTDEALAVVARDRPGAGPERGSQRELVTAMATITGTVDG